ncbi:homocysteine S-methyltransferase family protein [Paludicola sp. MB14-C6]|uniref:homocysteine S-methyltransferase family protein n=1 Tax=Paludihabitans sp. MB14-C6 TaxID=3070656 RepID=UPI0027DB94BE|nr:homocysteine S-methyltransferase family protein [Paludicola sp. MB14-C6]WMJ22061.1 homocysteine S-methyltransferase family protein [Paludicola sp. MB14-C6]
MDIPQSGYLLLDGATATNLYAKGMPKGICIEEYLLNHPELIQELQTEFVAAGSDIIYAPTFSANRAKLQTFGFENHVTEWNKKLVALTKEVANGKKVAGDLSPTGLFIEPYGDTTFAELVDIYKEQASALNEAGVDLFVIETMLSLSESRAAVIACREFNKPIFVTVTINEKGRLLSGATPLTCLITLQELGISAFGINCSCGPESLVECIEELSQFSKIPLIAKPNAGQPNPLLENVYDLSPVMMKNNIARLLEAGASIIGGCCGTTPEHIHEMRELLDTYPPHEKIVPPELPNDMILCNETQLFALDNERIEFTEPIFCEYDMADQFLTAEEDSFDVLLIHLNTVDDANQFIINSHLANLPVCFHSTNEKALVTALFSYQGRCIVDNQSPIEMTYLEQLSKKYGAILY